MNGLLAVKVDAPYSVQLNKIICPHGWDIAAEGLGNTERNTVKFILKPTHHPISSTELVSILELGYSVHHARHYDTRYGDPRVALILNYEP